MGGRGSGRTTRLIERAIELSRQGRSVYIVVANETHAASLRPRVAGTSVRVEVPASLGNLDWEGQRLKDAHPNCVVLIDHYACEREIAVVDESIKRLRQKKRRLRRIARQFDK